MDVDLRQPVSRLGQTGFTPTGLHVSVCFSEVVAQYASFVSSRDIVAASLAPAMLQSWLHPPFHPCLQGCERKAAFEAHHLG